MYEGMYLLFYCGFYTVKRWLSGETGQKSPILNKDDQIRLSFTLLTVPSVLAADTKVHSNMIQNACCLRSELQKQTCMLSLIHVFEFGKKYR